MYVMSVEKELYMYTWIQGNGKQGSRVVGRLAVGSRMPPHLRRCILVGDGKGRSIEDCQKDMSGVKR